MIIKRTWALSVLNAYDKQAWWIWKRNECPNSFSLPFSSHAPCMADKLCLPVRLRQQKWWATSQARSWEGLVSLLGSCYRWPEDCTRSWWAHRALAGPAIPAVTFIGLLSGWSASSVLEAHSDFKSIDVVVMDPSGWELCWLPVWLSWIPMGTVCPARLT